MMSLQVRPLSRQEVRSLDERAASELGLPTLVLMENAGRGAAALLAQHALSQSVDGAAPLADGISGHPQQSARRLPRICILSGPGNNGGDGGVVARHLDAWGLPVRILWLSRLEELRGDASTQWNILHRSGVDQVVWYEANTEDPVPEQLEDWFHDADWLVDGLLGTGLSRPVEGAFRVAIEAMNRSGKPVLALDLPSGLDADTGLPLGLAVKARLTATFVAPKRGFDAPGASAYTGEVEVIEIGLPRSLLVPFLQEQRMSPG